MPAQRFRVTFRKGERVRYISHLDVLRYWERAVRRAGLPLSYSQGFTPHPRLAFAGPLPLGFTSEAEIVDVSLDEIIPIARFEALLRGQDTGDLAVVAVRELPVGEPAPQAALRFADYEVRLDVHPASAAETVAGFLARETFQWTEEKREKARTYDLRAAVTSLRSEPAEGATRLHMRLRADPEMTGRPEQVVAALFPGSEPHGIIRTGLVLEESSPAREAWLRRGRYQ